MRTVSPPQPGTGPAGKRGGDDLQIVVAAVAGTGGAILALLLAVIVLISVGLVCCHRRPKVTGQYSYTDGQAR